MVFSGSCLVRFIKFRGYKNKMAYEITEKCTKCGACANECPVDAINFDGEKYVVDREKCIDCGTCLAACPVGAPRPEEEVD